MQIFLLLTLILGITTYVVFAADKPVPPGLAKKGAVKAPAPPKDPAAAKNALKGAPPANPPDVSAAKDALPSAAKLPAPSADAIKGAPAAPALPGAPAAPASADPAAALKPPKPQAPPRSLSDVHGVDCPDGPHQHGSDGLPQPVPISMNPGPALVNEAYRYGPGEPVPNGPLQHLPYLEYPDSRMTFPDKAYAGDLGYKEYDPSGVSPDPPLGVPYEGPVSNPADGVEITCDNDIFFGDSKYLGNGDDYCANIKCTYVGNKTSLIPDHGYCRSVRRKDTRSQFDIHHVHNTEYNIVCSCPELGHHSLPKCASALQLQHFKMIPRPVKAGCVQNYGKCGGGKFCFYSKESIQCPNICFLFTNYRGGQISVKIKYACCKEI